MANLNCDAHTFTFLSFRDDFWDVFNTMHAIIVRYYPEMADKEYYEKFLVETKEECKEYGTYIRWYRCHGQKPEAS